VTSLTAHAAIGLSQQRGKEKESLAAGGGIGYKPALVMVLVAYGSAYSVSPLEDGAHKEKKKKGVGG